MRLQKAIFVEDRMSYAIEQLYCKEQQRHGSPQDLIFWQKAFQKKRSLSRSILQDIDNQSFPFVPPKATLVHADKDRMIHRFSPLISILHKTMALWMSEHQSNWLLPCVHSYQKGKSAQTAIRALSDFLKKHFQNKAKKKCGLYFFRTDIESFTDSIRVDSMAPLWPIWFVEIEKQMGSLDASEKNFLKQLLCEPNCLEKTKGLWMGSSLVPYIGNLYLNRVDRVMFDLSAQVSDSLYLRFGDDLLFLTPEESHCHAAKKSLRESLDQLSLTIHSKKWRQGFLTSSGFSQSKEYKGFQSIEYLGLQCAWNGLLALNRDKKELLMSDLKNRLDRYCRAHPLHVNRANLARIVKNTLENRSLVQNPYAEICTHVITDHSFLRSLDHEILQMLSTILSGKDGVRSFRYVSKRYLRQDLGIPSLSFVRRTSYV